MKRKYAIELIPVKSYKKGLKDSERYHKSLAKDSKGGFTIANASFYSNVSQ